METITTPPSLWSALPATKLPTPERNTQNIHVTHMNVRQSISVMLFKLVIIELVAAAGVILFHTLIISTNVIDIFRDFLGNFTVFNVFIFLLLVGMKILLMIYVIIDWLNKYYEITPNKLISRKGFFFNKQEEFVFSHLMSIDIQQSLWGRVFNYGSIHLYDRYINKHVQMYLIHNPKKYYHILKELIPFTDTKQDTIREHIIEEDDLDDEDYD